MKRWFVIVLFLVLGLISLAVALVIPVYWRAIDSQVVATAGAGSPSLAEEGLSLVQAGKIGSARLLAQVATNLSHPARERLLHALDQIDDPSLRRWGSSAPELEPLLPSDLRGRPVDGRSIVSWLLIPETREKVFAYLSASQRIGVKEILRTRSLTNFAQFAPVTSPTGPPLEVVTSLTALLLQGNHLPRTLKDGVERLARSSVRRGEIAPLEAAYLDFLALGNRLDWGQLTSLLERIPSLEALHGVANVLRLDRSRFPVFFASFLTAPSPGEVLTYVDKLGPNALEDLQFSLGHGIRALAFVVAQQKPIYRAQWRDRLPMPGSLALGFARVVQFAVLRPGAVLAAKYVLVLFAGFCFGGAAARLVSTLRSPRRRRWWQVSANRVVFVGCFLILILAAAEPSLSQVRASAGPWLAAAGADGHLVTKDNPMLDLFTLISVIVFVIVQAGLYALCLSKLAEIRRQPVSSQLKLKLLENEENLFDSGLYAGLAGTAGSLILLAMGFIKPSLTAAYASTLFGVIFVAVLKIGHLRPYRKSLILTSEAGNR